MSADEQVAAPWTKKDFEAVVKRQATELADLRARLAAAEELISSGGDLTFWMTVADGVSHDPRCAEDSLCMRCQLELVTAGWKAAADKGKEYIEKHGLERIARKAAEQALATVTAERDSWEASYTGQRELTRVENRRAQAAEQQVVEVQGRFDAAVLSHEILERERNEAQRQLAEVRGAVAGGHLGR